MTTPGKPQWTEADERKIEPIVDAMFPAGGAPWNGLYMILKGCILAERERCAAVCRGARDRLRLDVSDQLSLATTVEACAAAILAGPGGE